jgi:alpha-tubulin suppressor-like RCC1 family protein
MDPYVFYNSANTNTFPILYSSSSAKFELLLVLQQLSFVRVGIVFVHNQFLDNHSFFESDNVGFIKALGVSHIDFLACETLNDPQWVNYYSKLSPITIGASNGKTGNIKYGGNWVMESTNEDIKSIYFTESIEHYTYLLDSTSSHTIGIKNDGTIWGTGANSNGQLGLGNLDQKTTLTQMTNISTPKYISCGASHTMVLMTNGTIWGTGLNNGQLGLGNTTQKTTLTQITSDISGCTPQTISCGDTHTMVLMTNGTIWGTGINDYGQLGLGNTTQKTTLTRITSDISGCTPEYISCGAYHTMVLMTNGTIWGTGINDDGQLGIGNLDQKTTLTQITSDISGCIPKYIACGNFHTMVLMTNGTIWGAGQSVLGQLGIGTPSGSKTTLIRITSDLSGRTPKYISCGYAHTMVLMTDGTIWGTGLNGNGQLGLNDIINKTTLTQITSDISGCTPKYISCGALNTMVLMTNGIIWGTGLNSNGQLGIGNTTQKTTLTKSTTNNSNFSYIAGMYDAYPYSVQFNTDMKFIGTESYQRLYDMNIQPSQMTISNRNRFIYATMNSDTLQFSNMSTSLTSSYGINGVMASEPVRCNYSTLSLPVNNRAVGYIQEGTPTTVVDNAQLLKTLVLGVGVWILTGSCGFIASTSKYHILTISTSSSVGVVETTCQTRVFSDSPALPVLQCQRFVTNDVSTTYYLRAVSESQTNIIPSTVVFQATRIA